MDMDGDGKLDIITCSYNASNVTVLRNTSTIGNISFAAGINYPTGSGAYGIITGDIDADGKPEIITGNYNQGGISVIRNASTIGVLSFGTFINFAGSGECHMVDIADIDGDGKKDIAAASRTGNLISVYRNTSTTGTITAASLAAKFDFSTPASGGEGVVASDIDGDGKLDLAVCGLGSNLTILRNTATSGIINASSFAAPANFGAGNNSYGISVGDLNGDGKPDVVPCGGASNLIVFQNLSTVGNISFAAIVNLPGNITNGFHSAVGDLDNDGKNDLVRAPLSGSDVNVYRNIVGVSAVATVTNITCNSVCNGGIVLATTASTSSVLWSNSSTSYSLTNLCSALYSYSLTTGTCVVTGTVNVSQPAPLTLSASTTNSLICNGNSATLTSNAAGGTSPLTYSWSSGPTASLITVSPTVSTVYTINVTDANLCAISSSISVGISANPTVAIVSSNSVACLGGSITLTANGASTYTWNTGSNNSSIAISPTATTVYTVSGLSAAGCSGANSTSTISLGVAPSPTVAAVTSTSLICAGNAATLTASGASTYSWSNGASTANAVITPTTNTTYTVTGIAANGCGNSAVISQSVSTCAGLKTNSISNSNLNLYPNPNNGSFKLEIENLSVNSKVEIYNNLGQLVFASQLNENNTEINISNLNNGLYTVKLIGNNNIISTQKMIKE